MGFAVRRSENPQALHLFTSIVLSRLLCRSELCQEVIFDRFRGDLSTVDVRFAPKRPVPGSAKWHCAWPYACDSSSQTGASNHALRTLRLWTAIKPMLPNRPGGVPRVNDRRVLNGIFWVLRSGVPWRGLPEAFGPYTTCYDRFVRWRRAGVWSRIIDALAAAHDAAVQMIDTSIVRVHQHGASITRNQRQAMGRSRGGLTSNIHVLVDSNGLPVRSALSPGEAHDVRLAGKLLSRLKSGSMLLADRGYDADWIRELAMKKGAWANIPPKSNRRDPICYSPYLYRDRNRVERFFNRIKQCRRIAIADNYLAFVQLASIRLWLRVNESAD